MTPLEFTNQHLQGFVENELFILRNPCGKARTQMADADFFVRNEGNIFLLYPRSKEAEEWASEHIPEDAQRFGGAIVVEHRYIADILEGAQSDGLRVDI